MQGTLNSDYLESIKKQFVYYKQLGDKTFEQLSDEALFHAPGPDSNSISVIVQHLHGNMLSRWTNFMTTDGEKDWRNRDAEFETVVNNRQDMLRIWEEGWQCFFTALEGLQAHDLGTIIYIRNQGHTVMEAINRQLAHYPYHIGQIAFLGKMLSGGNWKSLSIPKNASAQFNAEKFSKPKGRGHFTDEEPGSK